MKFVPKKTSLLNSSKNLSILSPDVVTVMIKKIKKYKITLRPSFVLKNLKRKTAADLKEEEIQQKIKLEIEHLKPFIVPSAVYDTVPPTAIPEPLKMILNSCPKNTVSVSLSAATIGKELEIKIKNLRENNDLEKCALVESIAEEALEQSLNFISKLLTDESKLEGCESSALFTLNRDLAFETLHFLESEKVEILLENNQMSPLYSSIAYAFWTPL
ncbi:MAG: hypothetical protein A3I11_04530 [Elusimicrobia bacterium RIFCSPLOWO2_02_FULL_39_32]|nr:MAG: hypothetical protein A3I11_04530 [Elusimicrobia bacterium RIFCSPLOWO2_02_FULL_39_32]